MKWYWWRREESASVSMSESETKPIRERGRLIVVWSPKSEGASTTAWHLATVAGKQEDTLLLDLNLVRPLLGRVWQEDVRETHSWELLWPMVESRALTPEALRRNVLGSKEMGFSLLAGTTAPAAAFLTYTVDPMLWLLEAARNAYQTVIVDVSAEVNNGAIEAALGVADRVLVVMRGNWYSVATLSTSQQTAAQLQLDRAKWRTAMIQQPEAPYQAKEIAAYTRISHSIEIPWVSDMDKRIALGEPIRGRNAVEKAYLAAMKRALEEESEST